MPSLNAFIRICDRSPSDKPRITVSVKSIFDNSINREVETFMSLENALDWITGVARQSHGWVNSITVFDHRERGVDEHNEQTIKRL